MTIITPSLSELLKQVLDFRLQDVHVALPGSVQKVDMATQTVDVLPEIKRVLEDEDGNTKEESMPILPNIPLVFPRAGGYFLTLPVAVGDKVLILFCEKDLDQWRAKGRETAPDDLRMHSTAGAVAIAGVYPTMSPILTTNSTDMILGKDAGSKIYIKPNAEIHLAQENPAQYIALATQVLTELTSLQTQINNIVTIMNANAVVFAAHTHPGVTPGPGVTGTPAGAFAPAVPVTAPNSVASTLVKSV